jgi:branched-chain amino acid transport system permease protein
MLYREVGQFKTSYGADQGIFPIAQDRWFVGLLIAFAFLAVPLIANQYLYTEVLIPVLILSLAAIGLNILTGYCGQLSLGTGGFMAVGAYAAYNLALHVPEINLILVFLFGGLMATLVGILFGLPSLRIKGFYLAVATLAAQFFLEWAFARVKWFTNYAPSGSVAVGRLELFGMPIDTPAQRYLLVLAIVVVLALAATNLVRGASGACGWRCATWTSRPRSSVSGRSTPSCRRLRSRRSISGWRAPCGASSGSARGSRLPSTSTARSRSCS